MLSHKLLYMYTRFNMLQSYADWLKHATNKIDLFVLDACTWYVIAKYKLPGQSFHKIYYKDWRGLHLLFRLLFSLCFVYCRMITSMYPNLLLFLYCKYKLHTELCFSLWLQCWQFESHLELLHVLVSLLDIPQICVSVRVGCYFFYLTTHHVPTLHKYISIMLSHNTQ